MEASAAATSESSARAGGEAKDKASVDVEETESERRARLDAEIDTELDEALQALNNASGGDERREDLLLRRVREGVREIIDTELERFAEMFEARLTQILTNSSTTAVRAVQKHLKGPR